MIISILVIFFSAVTYQLDVKFWISPLIDYCEWIEYDFNPVGFIAGANTKRGNLCAYVPSTRRVYACPAPDGYIYLKSLAI
jgi:hypothetical protein